MDGVDSKAGNNGRRGRKRPRSSPSAAADAADAADDDGGGRQGRRTSAAAPHDEEGKARRRNVPPPPPPPPALVALLKSDADVVSYFQSLQQNLEADVDVWKQRARTWQAKYEKKAVAEAHSAEGTKQQRSKKRNGGTSAAPSSRASSGENDSALKTSQRTTQQRKASTAKSQQSEKRSAGENDAPDSDHNVGRSFGGPDSDQSETRSVNDNAWKDILEEASSSSSSKASDDDIEVGDRETPRAGEVEAPIDDAMMTKLLMESDDDDDEEDKDHGGTSGSDVDGETCVPPSSRTRVKTSEDDGASASMEQLYWEEAVSFLRDELGIPSLSESVHPADSSDAHGDEVATDGKNGVNAGEEPSQPSVGVTATAVAPRKPHRLDPLEVVSEITAAVKSLCRVQQLLHEQDPALSRSYSPFHLTTLLPVIDGVHDDGAGRVDPSSAEGSPVSDSVLPPHPGIQAQSRLFRAVLVLDTLRIEAREARIHPPRLHRSHASLGMIIRNWLLSLQGEIAEGWACHDRAQQLTQSALVFESPGLASGLNPGSGVTTASTDPVTGDDLIMETPAGLAGHGRFTGGPKIHNRLSLLLERYWMAQLVIGVLLTQGKIGDAYSLFIDYVCSNAPVRHESARLAPTLSLVVIRGLLQPLPASSPCWLMEHIMSQGKDASQSMLIRSLSLVLRQTASLWEARLQSDDDRIVDVSIIELASWRNLTTSSASWLVCNDPRVEGDFPTSLDGIVHLFAASPLQLEAADEVLKDAMRLALVACSDVHSLNVHMEETLLRRDAGGRALARESAFAYRQLALRQVEALRDTVGMFNLSNERTQSKLPLLGRKIHPENEPIETLTTVLDCAELISDGEMLYRAVGHLLEVSSKHSRSELSGEMAKHLFHAVNQICRTPMVRVINLQRRMDRLDSFRAQCMRENLIAIHAIPDVAFESVDETPRSFFGGYAFDGGGRKAEVRETFLRALGEKLKLQELVSAEWCPNDLIAFDKDAPKDQTLLVNVSNSETACALSHIASWRGALQSFLVSNATQESNTAYFRHPQYLLRLFRLGGLATGDALLSRNSSMNPAPVCIILEDDSILVDRFRDRLDEVLTELPRDFHFCSLGYGRPKSAPILPFSKHVGIPSHLFYMTGYLVSEEGCRHLLSSLPVVGPIDTWIGLTMTKNWENSYGEALGVGSHSRPTTSAAPSRKDLSLILKFRAFCALTPLCSQRVGEAAGGGTEGRGWRLRDTDVEYSGDKLTHGRKRYT